MKRNKLTLFTHARICEEVCCQLAVRGLFSEPALFITPELGWINEELHYTYSPPEAAISLAISREFVTITFAVNLWTFVLNTGINGKNIPNNMHPTFCKIYFWLIKDKTVKTRYGNVVIFKSTLLQLLLSMFAFWIFKYSMLFSLSIKAV